MRDFTYKKRYVLAAFLITAVYFAAIWKLIGFSYAINDDINMRDIVSGAYTGQPDGHMIFILYPMGFVLKWLYTWLPMVEWYGIAMVGCHAAAMWVMLTAIFFYSPGSFVRGRQTKVLGVIFFLLAFTLLWLPQAVRVQFSTCAASAGTAALFWYGMGPAARQGRRLWEDLVTVALAAVCLCVRIEVFCITGAFAVILYMGKEGGRDLRGLFSRGALRLLVFVALASGLLYLADCHAYESPEWQEYLEFNQIRSSVYDYYEIPDYETYRDRYEALGLSEETVQALQDANILADDRVDTETFRQLYDLARQVYEEENPLPRRLSGCLELIKENFSPSVYGYLSGLSVFLWLLLLGRLLKGPDRKKGLLFWAGAVGLQACLWLYLGWGGRLPERVGLCLHLESAAAAFLLWRMAAAAAGEQVENTARERETAEKWRDRGGVFLLPGLRLRDGALLLALTALLAWGSYDQARAEADGRAEAQQMAELIEEYCASHSDCFYFADVYSLSAHTGRVEFLNRRFQRSQASGNEERRAVNYMRMGDWMTFSPLANEKLAGRGIESVTDSLVTDSQVYLIVRDDNPMDYLKTICREQFPQVTWHVTDVLNVGEFHMYVYQFTVNKEQMLGSDRIEQVQTSVNPQESGLMADGDSATRWNSGRPQEEGMTIDIRLDQSYELTGLRLDLFFYEDHPDNLQIYISENGTDWQLTEAESAGQVEFSFPTVRGRYIRLVLGQPQGDEQWNWSVYEIQIFAKEEV